MKAYQRSFVPTPMGSVVMSDATVISENTWANNGDTLMRFMQKLNFIMLVPDEESIGWWQYLHWRFPKALGWGEKQPPNPLPVYIDVNRWIPDYVSADAQEFDVVVATPELLDWKHVKPGSVLVLIHVENDPGFQNAFDKVLYPPGGGAVVGVGYKTDSRPVDMKNAKMSVIDKKEHIVPAELPGSYWSSLCPKPL